MTLFWILAAAMALAAVAFVLAPALRAPKTDDLDPARLNAAVVRQQLQELDRDLADGRLSQADYESAKADLERELLYAVEGQPETSAAAPRPSRARWLLAGAALFVPVAAFVLYQVLGTSRIITLLAEGAQATAPADGDAAPALPSIEEMVARLEQRLRENPDNAEGWVMLGRSYMVMNRYGDAAQAYAKANALLDERNADVLAAYAEALSLAQEGRPSEAVRSLTLQALAIDPDQPRALWLAGFDAFQQGDYQGAIQRWRKLAAQVDPASQDHANLQQAIQIARERMSAAAGDTSEGERAAAAKPAGETPPPARLEVRVAIADELAAGLQGDETVFIFARAAEGPRMPLAIVRKRVSDLPATVILDDAMAMTPQARLSAHDQVRIEARVARSGTARAQSGDLEGVAGPVSPRENGPVRVTIDRVVP
jgi:cytochrome c-type biogenesis protein CcmH